MRLASKSKPPTNTGPRNYSLIRIPPRAKVCVNFRTPIPCWLAPSDAAPMMRAVGQSTPPGLRAEPLRAPAPATPIGATQAPRDISLGESFDTFHPSFDELFDRFWSNFASVTRPKAERLESLTIEVPLTPDEARTGGVVRVLIPARAQCSACGGHGALGYYQCWHCGGHGSITADYPIEMPYPAGLLNEHIVRVSLGEFGICNFYLTIHFRVIAQS